MNSAFYSIKSADYTDVKETPVLVTAAEVLHVRAPLTVAAGPAGAFTETALSQYRIA